VKKIILAAVFTGYQGSAWCQPPASQASVVVPPITESTVVFTDRGRTYFAGTVTGRVISIDQMAPSPAPSPAPEVPFAGLAKQVTDSVVAIPALDPAVRKQGVEAMVAAIDATLSEAGGLGTTDPQAIINKLAEQAESSKASSLLKNWKLGDILAREKIVARDQLVRALAEVRKGLESAK
jgi:hypothetical protein